VANQSETKSHISYCVTHTHTFAQLDLLQISHTNMAMTKLYKPFIDMHAI